VIFLEKAFKVCPLFFPLTSQRHQPTISRPRLSPVIPSKMTHPVCHSVPPRAYLRPPFPFFSHHSVRFQLPPFRHRFNPEFPPGMWHRMTRSPFTVLGFPSSSHVMGVIIRWGWSSLFIRIRALPLTADRVFPPDEGGREGLPPHTVQDLLKFTLPLLPCSNYPPPSSLPEEDWFSLTLFAFNFAVSLHPFRDKLCTPLTSLCFLRVHPAFLFQLWSPQTNLQPASYGSTYRFAD